jgi:hypothetical protein
LHLPGPENLGRVPQDSNQFHAYYYHFLPFCMFQSNFDLMIARFEVCILQMEINIGPI